MISNVHIIIALTILFFKQVYEIRDLEAETNSSVNFFSLCKLSNSTLSLATTYVNCGLNASNTDTKEPEVSTCKLVTVHQDLQIQMTLFPI